VISRDPHRAAWSAFVSPARGAESSRTSIASRPGAAHGLDRPEVNQPIARNGHQRQSAFCAGLTARPPNLAETRQAVAIIVNDGIRAGHVLYGFAPSLRGAAADSVRPQRAIVSVFALYTIELSSNGRFVADRSRRACRWFQGDRVHCTSSHLIVNQIESMSGRELGRARATISLEINESEAGALVSRGRFRVRD